MSEHKEVTIGRDFSLPELIRFVAAPVLTRLLVSFLSTLDDSLFISRYCGQNAFAAFSMAMPWFMFVDAISMLVMGVGTLCSIKMGQKKVEEACSDFTTMVLISYFLGLLATLFLTFFLDELLLALGETPLLFSYARDYMTISKFYAPLIITNGIYSTFYVIAGKPKWSMYANTVNICCQFFFDWFFIARQGTGIVGAAYSNLIAQTVLTLIAFLFFSSKDHDISFSKPHHDYKRLLKEAFRYGRMQAFTSLSVALVFYVSNRVHLQIGGEDAVAAFSIVDNITFLFMNSFYGLIGALSPLAAYAYGEKNREKLARVCRQSLWLTSGLMIMIVVIIITFRNFFIYLYLNDASKQAIRDMVAFGIVVYPSALLFFGYNALVQDFSNVFGKGRISIFLVFMENIVFTNCSTIVLSYLFGIKGMWFSFFFAELFTFMLSLSVVLNNRDIWDAVD